MIDLHTHTVFSDGELIPSELVRRAVTFGYRGIGLTDHADFTNVEHILSCIKKAKYMEEVMDIRIIPGVEITHVHPDKIASLAKMAKELGANHIVLKTDEMDCKDFTENSDLAASLLVSAAS